MTTGLSRNLFTLAALLIFGAAAAAASLSVPRERLLLDFGWKFHLGNEWGIAQNLAKAGTGSGPASASFSDALWRTINLPHDWAIELPFDPKADGAHGFKALGGGFPENSVAWYRRTFELPRQDAGRRLWLEFDGVFRDCVVFLNGWCVGHHESGYSSFRFDVTDVANCGGRNTLAVKVDASQMEGWFYEGAGIYRHVWLLKTAPLAIVPDGSFVFSRFQGQAPDGPAEIHIQTRLANSQAALVEATVKCEILAPDGTTVAETSKAASLSGWSHEEVEQVVPLTQPRLWSPESPNLYRLVTTIQSAGETVESTGTEFGIRTVGFDAEKGFMLNGKPYLLKGTCNHQDHAGVGAALPDRLQYFRVAKLKEMGCNAYRTSHNPPTSELLEACDRLGMLVMDENRLLGSDAQNLDRLERLIRRDRNHPSVVIWSIANEEFGVQSTPAGARVAQSLQRFIQRLDPSRPVTYPAPMGNEFPGINSVIEVRGWNYHVGKDMDDYHQTHPNQPNVGTEQGSTVSTRGIYANDRQRGYVSAYDDNAPDWAHTAETWWSYFAGRPWLSGGFIWTGFDYRGEPTPYSWPCINSHFGVFDTCGFPKDNFWYYRSWWSAKPELHLLPHWNWIGKEGQEIDVRVFSNCEQVELFLNGASLGRQTMKSNSHLRWKVKYAPGTLSAKGYQAGRALVEEKVESTGEPAAIRLVPDRALINADGEDLSLITVCVIDTQGRVVPTAANPIQFDLQGPGRILGVGNGDPSCHEPDVYLTKWPLQSRAITAVWKWRKISDPHKPNPGEVAADFDDSAWAEWDVQAETGPLAQGEHGVFRAHCTISEQEMAAEALDLRFGMIDEEGRVFVNGQPVGESHDWRAAPAFDVKRLVHPGENTLAVVVANYSGPGGLNKGVSLWLRQKPVMPVWQRSVFNGLAQVIIQSSKEPGQLKLGAHSANLSPASGLIQSQPCRFRPSLP